MPVAHSARLDAAAEAAFEAAPVGALVRAAAAADAAPAIPVAAAGGVVPDRAPRLVFPVRTVVLLIAQKIGRDAVASGAPPLRRRWRIMARVAFWRTTDSR